MLHDMIDSASYMAHGYCLLWKPWLVTLHAFSDLLVFASYSAIPLAIWLYIRQRPAMELKGLAFLFVAFICLCGITHLLNVVTLWFPIYEFQGWTKLLTAFVSAATAVLIYPMIPKALAIPSPSELQKVNEALQQEVVAHKSTLMELEAARKALQLQVRAQSERLREADAIIDALSRGNPTLIYVKDNEGHLTYVNDAVLSALGKPREQIIGHNETEFLDDREAASAIMETDRRIRESKQWATVEEPLRATDGTTKVFLSTKSPFWNEQGEVIGLVGVSIDITERKAMENRISLLMNELSHRGRNLIAVITAIATQTFIGERPLKDELAAFRKRLEALGRGVAMLRKDGVGSLTVPALIRSTMETFGDRVVFDGPEWTLSPEASQSLALAVHELATNAVKHGALSRAKGKVRIAWGSAGRAGMMRFHWVEEGGPKVKIPNRMGFGMRMIKQLDDLVGSNLMVQFEDSGLRLTVDLPIHDPGIGV